MKNLKKRMKKIYQKFNLKKKYDLFNAIEILKESSSLNFSEGFDISINLNINSKKPEENIQGTILLPYSTGKIPYLIVFNENHSLEKNIKKIGADLVGTEEIISLFEKDKNIKKNTIVISSEETMNFVGKIAHILGPKGIMPNIKMGTITKNIEETVKNFKSGRVCRYKNDKYGIVHANIGKINFDINKLQNNAKFFLQEIKKTKSPQIKGIYIKKITVSTTMGPGIFISN